MCTAVQLSRHLPRLIIGPRRSSTKPADPSGSRQNGLLHGEGPGPVTAVPQPTLAHANVQDVVITDPFHAVRILGEVGLQTASAIGARRNVGDPLALTVISLSQPMTSAT